MITKLCLFYFEGLNQLHAVIMDVLAKSNPNEILEVYKDMGIAKISEDNRAFRRRDY